MPSIEALMELDGVEGAYKFSPKGELTEFKVSENSDLTESILDLLSHLCVANMSIATMQARGWESMTGMKGFYPINGFTLVGFAWTAVTSDEYGVVMPNGNVDYEAAYAALGQ